MLGNQDEKVIERWRKLPHNNSFKITNIIFFLFVSWDGVAAAIKNAVFWDVV
jgi:hypothetical protein